MLSIGINAFQIGIAVGVLQFLNVVLDIPTGILADRWKRKNVLMISAAALVGCSLVMAFSTNLPTYLIGVGFYAAHVVTASTTIKALAYDTLQEAEMADTYSKYGGRVGSLMFAGYALAGLAGAWLFSMLGGYKQVYLAAIVPAVACFVLAASIREPYFHRPVIDASHPYRQMIGRIRLVSREVLALGAVRALFTIMCLLWVVEAFKEGFGQLYFLRYVSDIPLLGGTMSAPAIVSLLFGIFYMIWALGEWFADLFKGKLTLLAIGTVAPVIVMLFVDNWLGVVAFMVQAFLSAALFVHIETAIHNVTPSDVRATVMSVRTFSGRLLSTAAIPFIGWSMGQNTSFQRMWIVALFAVAALVVWLAYGRRQQMVAPVVDK